MNIEKTYTVGRLARRFGLSRSTLLYYDSIGLLKPFAHAPGEYRQYTEADAARLETIMTYRKAGLPLAEIRQVMAAPDSRLKQALEARLAELSGEMRTLREQQGFILKLLGGAELPGDDVLDKKTWTSLLKASGLSEQDMVRWHAEFERRSPENHRRFLRLLCIPEEEIRTIRSWSRAPQDAARIQKLSTRQIELLVELFSDTPRQGPGSPETTQRALGMLPQLPQGPEGSAGPEIVEVGCGEGGTTLDLARHFGGRVTAVDVFDCFLDKLRAKITATGLSNISIKKQDMAVLDFEAESLDLIWAESCVFIIGFEAAVASWNRFLKPGGVFVVSDVSWLTESPGDEIREFWAESYPAMLNIREHLEVMAKAGYECLDHFTQPESDWEMIYRPMREGGLARLEAAHPDDVQARELITAMRREMELYSRYSSQYGHEFYIMRKL